MYAMSTTKFEWFPLPVFIKSFLIWLVTLKIHFPSALLWVCLGNQGATILYAGYCWVQVWLFHILIVCCTVASWLHAFNIYFMLSSNLMFWVSIAAKQIWVFVGQKTNASCSLVPSQFHVHPTILSTKVWFNENGLLQIILFFSI